MSEFNVSKLAPALEDIHFCEERVSIALFGLLLAQYIARRGFHLFLVVVILECKLKTLPKVDKIILNLSDLHVFHSIAIFAVF